MGRERRIYRFRNRMVTETIITCDKCGASASFREEYDADHDELINKKRMGLATANPRYGHYKKTACIYCGLPLTGRQKKYCSDRCRMRYNRG